MGFFDFMGGQEEQEGAKPPKTKYRFDPEQYPSQKLPEPEFEKERAELVGPPEPSEPPAVRERQFLAQEAREAASTLLKGQTKALIGGGGSSLEEMLDLPVEQWARYIESRAPALPQLHPAEWSKLTSAIRRYQENVMSSPPAGPDVEFGRKRIAELDQEAESLRHQPTATAAEDQARDRRLSEIADTKKEIFKRPGIKRPGMSAPAAQPEAVRPAVQAVTGAVQGVGRDITLRGEANALGMDYEREFMPRLRQWSEQMKAQGYDSDKILETMPARYLVGALMAAGPAGQRALAELAELGRPQGQPEQPKAGESSPVADEITSRRQAERELVRKLNDLREIRTVGDVLLFALMSMAMGVRNATAMFLQMSGRGTLERELAAVRQDLRGLAREEAMERRLALSMRSQAARGDLAERRFAFQQQRAATELELSMAREQRAMLSDERRQEDRAMETLRKEHAQLMSQARAVEDAARNLDMALNSDPKRVATLRSQAEILRQEATGIYQDFKARSEELRSRAAGRAKTEAEPR